MMTSVLFKSKLFAASRREGPRGNKGPRIEPRRTSVFFPSFSFIIITFFYHSYHKNNCLSRKDESFFNNRGQNIVTAYDRDINKTNKTRHKDK